MPKTKVQELLFTLLTSGVMIFIMGVYNVSIQQGKLSADSVFTAVKRFPLEWGIGFLLAFFVASKAARYFSRKILVETDRLLVRILCIQTFTVCCMVPLMSFVGVALSTGMSIEFPFIWIQTICLNFIAALPLQYVVVGPLCRKLFQLAFLSKPQAASSEIQALDDGFAE